MQSETIAAGNPFLEPERRRLHKRRNLVHSALLIAGIGTIMLISASLIWSWLGALLALLMVLVLAAFGFKVPPDAIMRLYRARPLDARHGGQLAHIVEVLADRAELPAHPRLYVIPSMTLNAFAAGRPDRAAIAVTEGLLRRLSLREVTGVLAHEMSHIRNGDLVVMGLADAMTRYTQVLSYVAVLLAILNLPAMLFDEPPFPWSAIVLLYLAPAASSLLQLGLSRTREYDADLEAVGLTGDPIGLASALRSLERYQGRFWEDLMLPVPGRRIPQPSVLRSHPHTEDRIARLLDLGKRAHIAPIKIVEEPLISLVGVGPIEMAPRFRWPGVWF
jgi:heat shock protein HtpX